MPRLASLILATLPLVVLPGLKLTAQEMPESHLLKATEARREAQEPALRAAAVAEVF